MFIFSLLTFFKPLSLLYGCKGKKKYWINANLIDIFIEKS